MVICKFFQQGSCRFGPKCVNEHVDIKQLIKSEVESALNGSQWPLSCFGPFKEKMCIPNFIEDQSFEEIRYLCLTNNNSMQFQQQFGQQIMEAQNKMKALLLLNRDVIDIVSNIYENSETQKNTTSNPFGSIRNTNNNGSIFSNNFTQPSSNNLAGQLASTNNIFAQNTPTNILPNGFSNNANSFGQQQQSSTIFGQQQQNNLQNTSVFQQNNQPASGNIFGQQNQLFGQQQNSQPNLNQQANNIFGGNAFSGSNNFNSNQTNNNIFGGSQQKNPQMFDNTQPNLIFGGNPPNLTSNNIFQQQQQQQQQLLQQQQQQHHQLQQQQNLQQPLQLQQAPDQQSVNNGNIFAQPNTLSSPQPQGIFAAATQVSNNSNTFNQTNNSVQLNQGFNQNSTQSQLANNQSSSSKIYSKLESLSADDLEAFKADRFTNGKIPTAPPPRELC